MARRSREIDDEYEEFDEYDDPEFGGGDDDDGYRVRPRRSSGSNRVIAVLLGVIVVMFVAGGLALIAVLGQPAVEANPPCKGVVQKSMRNDATSKHALYLVDVPSNDPLDARLISSAVAHDLAQLAHDGIRVELLYDFGTGTGIAPDRCFDGRRTLEARMANKVNQERLDASLEEDIAAQIDGQLHAYTAQPTGGPARLLRQAQRLSTDQTTQWFLWSDLLANDQSCFDVSGGLADVRNANASIGRCIDAGVLALEGPTLVLAGAGESGRSAGFDEYAVNVEKAICSALEGRCRNR